MPSSPYLAKLGTNYVPKDDELEHLAVVISKLGSDLQSLAVDGGDLDTQESYQQQFEANRALMSPLRRMPLDIIQEIFAWCLPMDENYRMNVDAAPLLLGRICSSWREIAYSTPLLWSKLHVEEPETYSYGGRKIQPTKPLLAKLRGRREATTEWLMRSGSCPLSISFACREQFADFERSILPALVPFTSRWEHISITATTEILPHIAHITAEEVPLLKSLHLVEIFANNRLGLVERPWELLAAPNLTTLRMLMHFFDESLFTVQWANLVNLEISLVPTSQFDTPSSQRAFDVAARCPNLRVYTITLQNFDDFTPPDSVLELAYLHTFHVLSVGGLHSCVKDLLAGRLLLPKLRDLRWHGKAPWQMPLDLSYKPFCSAARYIEVIDISFDLFTKDTLAEFFGLISRTLRKVKMWPAHNMGPEGSEVVFDDDILHMLSSVVDYPSLEDLDISFGAFSEQALLDFVAVRMKAQKLKHVAVTFRDPKTLDVYPMLRPFLDVGLHATVGYRPADDDDDDDL
ncbi:F-box domain-containing protein [Mycena indigotica]|uniref:F-box domain-containing protein n=1 Tax=Mycena indigotica TaxID=2126181 RepID=A0A8H6TFZ4_9AGAR|nr:F-box domain-containing protein [Mycena indigotica]KAF7315971.1 F-box domain-containing protein [Mycena indigotica]